jgi:type II secretory pathway predicted ATPase ExeA
MSPAALSRMVNYGEYPTRRDIGAIKATIQAALSSRGLGEIEFPAPGLRPNYGLGIKRGNAGGVALERHVQVRQITQEDIELMQLDRSVLNLFGLRTNPFLNDVEAEEDVFPYKGHAQVEAAIREAIEQRGFLAVTGPSGAGKTTIWDGIEAEYGTRDDAIICKPQLKHKEKLTPEHLCRALIYGLLGEDARIHRDAEDRGRQLSAALRAIRSGAVDRKAILYIDDAHFCNASVLRQLKTFYEEKIGRYRLLAIILVGLPTLKEKLAAFPEIGNRIRLVEVPPVPVQEYLGFKLKRVGSGLDRLFDGGGLEAFVERFKAGRRQALGYPLIINATCIRAMVKLHENGAQPGERISRAIIDAMPGAGAAARRAA